MLFVWSRVGQITFVLFLPLEKNMDISDVTFKGLLLESKLTINLCVLTELKIGLPDVGQTRIQQEESS